VLASVGLLAAVAYLVWRAGWSWEGARWWLTWPLLFAEVAAAAGGALLAWALWPRRRSTVAGRAPLPGAVDVVVRADGHPDAELRATLISVRRVFGIERVHVATAGPTARLHQAAADHRGSVLELAADDPAALVACSSLTAPWVLLLDAGDVLADDVLLRCADVITGDVGAVQVAVTSSEGDSAEHQADGHHELHAERVSILPALGDRGTAFITESVTLLRTEALAAGAARRGHREQAAWRTTLALWRKGWRVVTTVGAPAAVRVSRRDAHDVLEDRTVRAGAARELVLGRDGALFGRGWSPRQRLSMLAWSVRPLAGFRRTVMMIVIAGSLLAGRAPFRLDPVPLALGFLPAFVLVPLGLFLLSDYSLRPGDRTRWSLRTLGPAWRSLAMPPAGTDLQVVSPTPIFAAHLAPASVVVLISVIVAMRGVSERLTGALHEFPERDLVLLLLAALWLLAMALDSLRLLGVGRALRSSNRRPAALPAEVGDDTGFVVDLSIGGAGVVLPHAPLPGERMTMRMAIPHSSGCTTAELPVIIRHVRRDLGGQWLVGTEFTSVPSSATDALAEYAVVDPAITRLQTGRSPAANPPRTARNAALRTVAFSGLLGAFVSVDVLVGPDPHTRPMGVAVVVAAALVGFAVVLGSRQAHR
jgi:hypothetical protein